MLRDTLLSCGQTISDYSRIIRFVEFDNDSLEIVANIINEYEDEKKKYEAMMAEFVLVEYSEMEVPPARISWIPFL
jgi:hypothetical protein